MSAEIISLFDFKKVAKPEPKEPETIAPYENIGFIDYEQMISTSLLDVVRNVLIWAEGGEEILGKHHFYISFLTNANGVVIPSEFKSRDEMSIVLQHQYRNLEVGDYSFSVNLSFDGVENRVTIPFDAITSFADPSVQFILTFAKNKKKVG